VPRPEDPTAPAPRGCPVTGPATGQVTGHASPTLPTDGSPLHPSPVLGEWREQAPATPLHYADGHRGWIVTRLDLARAVLEDARFSQRPQRFPLPTIAAPPELDVEAQEALASADLLNLDGAEHVRLRRSLTKRFSFRAVQAMQESVSAVVASALDRLLAHGSPADIAREYAEPISAAMHCHVLGIPPSHAQQFSDLFVEPSTTQRKFDFIREVLALRAAAPGDDVLSDLLAADLSPREVQGLSFVLMVSGRDSAASMISTSVVALLTHPDQLALVRRDPSVLDRGVEELLRFGTPFLTVFPRTALEDVELPGLRVEAGQTVSVSPMAANRDETAYVGADSLDLERDALGHLTFGHGRHGCVGQQLARMEVREAVSQLVTALPTLRLVDADQASARPFAHEVGVYDPGSARVAWD
jgi:cytochrome P450